MFISDNPSQKGEGRKRSWLLHSKTSHAHLDDIADSKDSYIIAKKQVACLANITVSESYRSSVQGGLRCANVISAILRFRRVSPGECRRQNAS